jgi:23S rRNA (uracil1939-C5)-methyltransferase
MNPRTPSPGDSVSLAIEKPAAGGRMIARLDGRVVLVGGAIPGERVTARIERAGKGVLFADTVSPVEPSPDRRPVLADPLCGGCLYAHIEYARQLVIKSDVIADAFARIGHVELPGPVRVAPSPEEGYRMRARLHVRGQRYGFFREGTHDICDARATRQLLPASCDVLDRLTAALRSVDAGNAQGLREIELSENVDASGRAVCLDMAGAMDLRTVQRLAETEGLTGFGPQATVTDMLTVGDVPLVLRRNVLAFFQGNRFLLQDLVAHVVGQVPAGASVVDLYAGAGLFAIGAAACRSAHVKAVEGDRVSAADLTVNAAAHDVEARHEPVEEFLAAVRNAPDALIVDPPRTGMSREALDGVTRLRAGRLIYVSCDVATLARDSRRLVDSGYAVTRADAFDLFPNTPHVETVVVFDRPSG